MSVHRDAAFTNCTFSHCSFFDTQFIDCKLIGSAFDRSTYDLRKVAGGNWSFVALPGAWLGRANFTDCDLRGSDLSALDLQESVVTGAIISYEQALMIATTLGLDVRPD